jgi:hypothetical protein
MSNAVEAVSNTIETATIYSAIGVSVAAIAALIGLILSYLIHRNQQSLAEKLNNSQQSLATKLHESQQLLTQRQLLVPLWSYMSNLDAIDPQNPITPNIIKVLNTLELVAACCEGGMIDEKVIKRTFSHDFMTLYDSIESCTKIPGLSKTGKELLHEAKAATLFYIKLKNEHLQTNIIN